VEGSNDRCLSGCLSTFYGVGWLGVYFASCVRFDDTLFFGSTLSFMSRYLHHIDGAFLSFCLLMTWGSGLGCTSRLGVWYKGDGWGCVALVQTCDVFFRFVCFFGGNTCFS
jgi:hypothetical protein